MLGNGENLPPWFQPLLYICRLADRSRNQVFRNADLVDVGKEITLGVIASAKDKDTA